MICSARVFAVLNDCGRVLLRLLANLPVVGIRLIVYLLLKAVGFIYRGLIARIRCIRDFIRLRLRFGKDALLFIHDCLCLHDSVRQNDAQLTNQVDDFARIDKTQRLGHGNAARVIDSVFELIDDPTRLRDAVACWLTVFFADGSGFLLLCPSGLPPLPPEYFCDIYVYYPFYSIYPHQYE